MPPSLVIRTAAVVAVTSLAAGCADSDITADATSTTGAASITASSTAAPTTAAPQENGSTTTSAATPTTTTPPAGDPAQASIQLVEVTDDLDAPLSITWVPGRSGAGLISTKEGRIVRVELASGSTETVADISSRVSSNSERGLLGLAADPSGDWLYGNYTDPAGDSRLVAWPLDGDVPDTDAEVELLEVGQPYSNHNGGDLHIGPDGNLYWSLGDGGSAGDPQGNGQDPSSLLGTILRVTPTPGEASPLAIPADNPFVSGGGAAEVWQWGLRNPWRFSFDRLTGDLWVGDVGQSSREEVNRLPAGLSGANFGWNCFEGDRVFSGCEPSGNVVGPFYTYGRDRGLSVTGGYVYRGSAVPELAGAYLFADYGNDRIWALPEDTPEAVDLGLQVDDVVSFGEDPEGEIYVVTLSGRILRIEPA